MCLRVTTIEIALACHARQSPEILVFAPRPVAPAPHHERQFVIASLQIAGDVKLRCRFRVFSIADKTSVHPQTDAGGDAAEMGDDLFPLPSVGNGNRAPIHAFMVVFQRHIGSFPVKMPEPCIPHIFIYRVAEAVQLPHSGNGHRAPRHQFAVGIRGTTERPIAMQRQEARRTRFVTLPCQLLVLVSEKRRVNRQAVQFVHLQVMPSTRCHWRQAVRHQRSGTPCRKSRHLSAAENSNQQ